MILKLLLDKGKKL